MTANGVTRMVFKTYSPLLKGSLFRANYPFSPNMDSLKNCKQSSCPYQRYCDYFSTVHTVVQQLLWVDFC